MQTIRFSDIMPFQEGLAAIQCKSKWGFINKSGEFQIPCIYDEVMEFCEGKAAVRKGNRWGYIDYNNSIVIECNYDAASCFADNLAPVKNNGLWGVIDEQGTIRIHPVYNFISIFSEGVTSAEYKGRYGYIDKNGNTILPFIYEYASDFSKGIAYVKTDDKHGFINLKGEFVLELSSQQVPLQKVTNEYIFVCTQETFTKYIWSIYSNDGLLISSLPENIDIDYFKGETASVHTIKNKFGIINMQGQFVVPCEYDYTSPLFCGLLVASLNKKFGYIDKDSNIIIPFKYDDARVFCENLTCVNRKGWNSQIIDIKGNVVVNLKKEVTLRNILKAIFYFFEGK